MGIWSTLFGSVNVVEKGLELADKAFYTDQEKADNFGRLMAVYEPFKLIQRILVITFCVPFALLHTAVIIGCMFGSDWSQISVMINDAFGYPVAAAVTLYLGGGVLEGGINAYRKKAK